MKHLTAPATTPTRPGWRHAFRRAFTPALTASALLLACGSGADTLFRFEFNEGSGTTVTDEAGIFTGIFAGREPSFPESVADSPSGSANDRALDIVDPDGYVVQEVENAPALQAVDTPITVEAWIRIPADAVPRNESIIAFGGSWKFGLRASGYVAFTLYGVADVESQILPDLDQWNHVAAVWEPGVGVTFYWNGIDYGFVEQTGAMNAPGNNRLVVGGSSAFTEPVNATLDRVRVHRAILNADQLDTDPATPRAPLASTVVAFNFNEAEAPFANTGTIGGEAVPAYDLVAAQLSPQFVSDTPSGQEGDFALSFDGNDILRVEDPDNVVTLVEGDVTSDFTIQAWVKPGTQPAGQARSIIFSKFGATGALSFSITSDRRVVVTTYGIVDMFSNATIPDDGLWHHIAVVHDTAAGEMRFYVDGILGDTIPYTNGLQTRDQTWFFFGTELTGILPYVGLLDRVELLNEALPADELDFRPIPGVDPEAPELEIGVAVSISWPATATGFRLESTLDLEEPREWTPVDVPGTVVDNRIYVLLPTPAEATFYRLVRPNAE